MKTDTPTALLSDLIPWPDLNPRRVFGEEEIDELRASIQADGILQPIGVKPNATPPHYIFAGERRWRAAHGVQEEVPVVFRDIDETAARRLALTENIQRSNLTALEEALGIERYLGSQEGLTQSEVARDLGKTQGWVSNRLRLLKLSSELQEVLWEGHISATQARDLILPFAGIPEHKWDLLNVGVEHGIRRRAGEVKYSPLTDEDVRLVVSGIAIALSSWVDRGSYDWQMDKGKDYPEGIYIPKSAWSEAPPGTLVKYQWGRYAADKKTVRAFDDEWWSAQMALAKAESDKKVLDGATSNGGDQENRDLDWKQEMGPIPADVSIAWHQEHVVYQPKRQGSYAPSVLRAGDLLFCLSADPTAIPAELLVLQEGSGHRTPRVLCTDAEVYNKARQALIERRDALIERKRVEQLHRDLDAAAEVVVAEAIPTLVALGFTEVHPDPLEESAKDLGLTFPDQWVGNSDGRDMNLLVEEFLVNLGDEPREKLLQLAVIRALRPEGHEAPDARADRILGTTLRDELAALVPFTLPGEPVEEES